MKAEFLSELAVKALSDTSDKWELLEPLVYASAILNKIVTVPKGFQTDFASVPRIPLAYWLAGNVTKEPPTVHDYLYHIEQVPRGTADDVFLEAMAATGVWWWRRELMWLAVRCFGYWARKDDLKEVKETGRIQ